MKLNTEGSAQKAMLESLKNFHFHLYLAVFESIHSSKLLVLIEEQIFLVFTQNYIFIPCNTNLFWLIKPICIMGGPVQNLGLYNMEILVNQTFSVVWQKLFFSRILFKITTAKLTVSQVSVFPIIKSEFTKCIFCLRVAFSINSFSSI